MLRNSRNCDDMSFEWLIRTSLAQIILDITRDFKNFQQAYEFNNVRERVSYATRGNDPLIKNTRYFFLYTFNSPLSPFRCFSHLFIFFFLTTPRLEFHFSLSYFWSGAFFTSRSHFVTPIILYLVFFLTADGINLIYRRVSSALCLFFFSFLIFSVFFILLLSRFYLQRQRYHDYASVASSLCEERAKNFFFRGKCLRLIFSLCTGLFYKRENLILKCLTMWHTVAD